jgi:hypothetical protein
MFLLSWFGNEVHLFVTKASLIHSTKQTIWSYCVSKVLEERMSKDSAVRKEPNDLLNKFQRFKYDSVP